MDLVRRQTEHAPSIYIIIFWKFHIVEGMENEISTFLLSFVFTQTRFFSLRPSLIAGASATKLLELG
jgi:hypothetical protein